MLLRTMGLAMVIAGMAARAGAGGVPWKVSPGFSNDEAAVEISGAVCPGSDGTAAWCVAVNDEKKYVQFFAIEGEVLRPGKRARILPKRRPSGGDWGEPDLEAAAYADGFVYLAGSHGARRKGDGVQASRFFLYRLPVDATTGRPSFEITRDRVAPGIERTAGLRELIRANPVLGPFAELPPDENGVNIEGLAARGGRLFVGFRAPVGPDGAVILELPWEAAVTADAASVLTHAVQLGIGYGIRDLAPLGAGFLVLAGAAGAADLVPAIWYWEPGAAPVLVTILDDAESNRAEGLLPISPAPDGAPRVLVFFDGEKDGGPVAYALPRP